MTNAPDPKQLQQFLALLENRSFRFTAEQLGLSQSALTKSLQRFEAQLGCRLFDRTTRSVAPTDAALALRPRAEAALRSLSAFADEAGVIAGSGTALLRVGAIALATESVVVPALARMAQVSPEVQVELTVGSADVYEDLASGRCDVVVGDQANAETSPYSQSLRVQRLKDEPLLALFRHEHPQAEQPTTDALLRYPWAIPSRYFLENASLRALANRASHISLSRYKMTSLSACISLAQQTDVVAVAPQGVVHGRLAQGLAAFDLGLGLSVRLALFTLARVSPSPSVRYFQEALQHSLLAMAEGS